MDADFKEYAQIFKALSDPNRLRIVKMLSGGELCACVVLEEFQITQPTLSHHLKTLCDCQLVQGRKEGKWTHYSLNEETVRRLKGFLEDATTAEENPDYQTIIYREDCCK